MSENINSCKSMESIRDFWNKRPCNSHHSKLEKGTREYFDEVEEKNFLLNLT